MPDFGDIASALTSFKALKDIAQAMISLRDSNAFHAKLIEFNSALIDAQTKVFAVNQERSTLIERVRDLEAKIAEMEGWEAEKQRYELKEVGTRVFAYVVKQEAQGPEPPHWICPSCYQNHQKSILQGFESHSFGWSHRCPSCKLEIQA
jgi:hypothetical protein